MVVTYTIMTRERCICHSQKGYNLIHYTAASIANACARGRHVGDFAGHAPQDE